MRLTFEHVIMLVVCCVAMAGGMLLDLRAGAWPLLTSMCGQHIPFWQALQWQASIMPASNAGMMLVGTLGSVLRPASIRGSASSCSARCLHGMAMAVAMLVGMDGAMTLMPAAHGSLVIRAGAMALTMLAGMSAGMLMLEAGRTLYKHAAATLAR